VIFLELPAFDVLAERDVAIFEPAREAEELLATTLLPFFAGAFPFVLFVGLAAGLELAFVPFAADLEATSFLAADFGLAAVGFEADFDFEDGAVRDDLAADLRAAAEDDVRLAAVVFALAIAHSNRV
jgi:hypothetical protein